MNSLRKLVPELPARVWALEGTSLVSALGYGMVVPFQVIYFHNVRGFSFELAGTLAATVAGSALAGGFLGGSASDRFGPRRAAILSALVAAAGYSALGLAASPAHAFPAALVTGLGFGGLIPSKGSLLASMAPESQRHAAYGADFAATNLGFAAGAAIAGSFAHVTRPGTFTAIYFACAGCHVLFSLLVSVIAPRQPAWRGHAERAVPYREVLRQRAILGFVLVTLLFAAGGVAVYEVALPLFGKNVASLNERQIALLFLLNSIFIVLAQLPIAKLLEGRRRLRLVAVALGLWACAWLAVAGAGSALHGTAALALFVPVVLLFALGECIIAPIQGSLVADIAPEHLRGRSLALTSNAFGIGLMVGPIVIGFALARARVALWLIAAGVVALGAFVALRLEPAVPRAARRVASAQREALAPADP